MTKAKRTGKASTTTSAAGKAVDAVIAKSTAAGHPAGQVERADAEARARAEAATEAKEADGRETASERARGAGTVEERIRLVRDMMLADEWDSELIPVLAGVWDLSESRIKQLSGEASRRIRDTENKPLVRARLLDRLDRTLGQTDEAFDRAREEESDGRASEAMTKATESATRAILATAQIAGVSVADKGVPHLTINVGQVARSAVLDELWGEPTPRTIEAHGEPVEDPRPGVHAGELPARVHEGGALPDDGWR